MLDPGEGRAMNPERRKQAERTQFYLERAVAALERAKAEYYGTGIEILTDREQVDLNAARQRTQQVESRLWRALDDDDGR